MRFLILGLAMTLFNSSFCSLTEKFQFSEIVPEDTLLWNEPFENPKVLMETVQLNHIYLVIDKTLQDPFSNPASTMLERTLAAVTLAPAPGPRMTMGLLE